MIFDLKLPCSDCPFLKHMDFRHDRTNAGLYVGQFLYP